MKKFLLALVLISFGAGAFAAVENPTEAMFKTWYGVKIKKVVKYWGQPTDIEYDQSQKKYKWLEHSTRYIPGTQYQKRVACERVLIVDVSGRVVFGKYNGTGCPFTTEGVKQWINPEF